MNAISQTFDIKRFGLNLKRDLLSDWRSWLTRLLMITGTTTLAMIILQFNSHSYDIDDASKIFKIFAMVFCALGASLFMKNMSTKGLRLNSLMSPTSELEKFLTRWVICIVGVFVCYIVCFAIADLLRVGIMQFYEHSEPLDLRLMDPFSVMLSGDFSSDFWISLIFSQSVFLLGSTVWPKDSFRKTFGALIIIGVVCGLIFTGVMSWLLRKYVIFGYTDDSFEESIINARWYIYAVIIVFNYVVAWFRFRESEIIHRF